MQLDPPCSWFSEVRRCRTDMRSLLPAITTMALCEHSTTLQCRAQLLFLLLEILLIARDGTDGFCRDLGGCDLGHNSPLQLYFSQSMMLSQRPPKIRPHAWQSTELSPSRAPTILVHPPSKRHTPSKEHRFTCQILRFCALLKHWLLLLVCPKYFQENFSETVDDIQETRRCFCMRLGLINESPWHAGDLQRCRKGKLDFDTLSSTTWILSVRSLLRAMKQSFKDYAHTS